MGIRSSLQSIAETTDPMRSYWSVKLSSGKEINEQGIAFDLRAGGIRPVDWSLDLVSTGDIYKIKEVSLHCPDGQSVVLLIDEPGTVFQLKIASLHLFSEKRQVEAHLIGKVIHKESGRCVCLVWDRQLGLLTYRSFVGNNKEYGGFGSWRPGIIPLGKLSLDVLGLRL